MTQPNRIPLTDEQRTQIDGYTERFRIVTLKQWRAQGFDVSAYQDLLGGPSLVRKAVNFTKAVTKHVRTGAKKVPPDVQAERLAKCKGCEYFGLARPGECGHKQCGCFLKTKIEWATSFCPDGLWGAFVEGDKPVDDPAGNLPVLSGNVVGEGSGVEEVPKQPNGEPHRRVDGEVEAEVDDPADETHGAGPGDGFGPIHNAALSLPDHENFVNPEEKLMSPAPPETDSAGLLPSPVSPGASDCEVTE